VSTSISHAWDVTTQEAREIQTHLRDQVVARDQFGTIRSVAGIDVGFHDHGKLAKAAVAVLRFPGLQHLESSVAQSEVRFPYVPGLLSFREAPIALAAMRRLKQLPDLMLCDGQGLAHPRRFGLACHLGVLLDRPSIGVAKTRLIGDYREPANAKGAWTPLEHQGEVIGAAVRTRTNTNPVYVSVGHRIGLETAIDFVLRCTPRFRLPETTRAAHKLASG